jgi:hypothetical protein
VDAHARSRAISVLTAVVAAVALSGSPAYAFPAYSEDPDKDTGYCAGCHGNFDGDDYTSMQDDTPWNNNLMDAHREWVNNACTACHQSPGAVPVVLNDSGSNTFPNSCAGCHGRDQDAGTDTGQPVEHPISLAGAGLRQHHYRAGVMVCADCHGDANPANYTTVGEEVLPFNYATGQLADTFNDDPCADAQFGPTGLDNDGDADYDAQDTDCGAPGNTPGEALLLLVTSHDPGLGDMTLSYTPACSVDDHAIEFGSLAQVSSYTYAGQECLLGNSGSYVWSYPVNPESLFFVVVGNNGAAEGSYGRNSGGVERPEDTLNPFCNIPQNLDNPCN